MMQPGLPRIVLEFSAAAGAGRIASAQFTKYGVPVMKLFSTVFASVGLAAAAAATAEVQPREMPVWRSVAGWTIIVDEQAGGCMMQKTGPDDMLVQFGFLPKQDGAFFAAYSEAWTGIENGARGLVGFVFGDTPFPGEAVGAVVGPWQGAYVFTKDAGAIFDAAQQGEVTVTDPQGAARTVDLSQTAEPVAAIFACQEEQPA